MASPLTTHVLDTAHGVPAAGVVVSLWKLSSEAAPERLTERLTNHDGRVPDLVDADRFGPGRYQLRFEVAAYFAARGESCFFPWAEIVFDVTDLSRHHHVPLLVSPFSWSTYRGS